MRGQVRAQIGFLAEPELANDFTVPAARLCVWQVHNPYFQKSPERALPSGCSFQSNMQLLSSYCMPGSAEVPGHEALVSGSQRSMRVH